MVDSEADLQQEILAYLRGKGYYPMEADPIEISRYEPHHYEFRLRFRSLTGPDKVKRPRREIAALAHAR